MPDFMKQVEAAMLALSKFASTVVEDLKSKSKWIAEVETSLMTKIFAVPKSEDGKTVQQQEAELGEHCAAFIATKVLEVREYSGVKAGDVDLYKFPSDTKLLATIQAHLNDSSFQWIATTTGAKKQDSVVTEKLAPKVILMEEDGRPLSRHETVVVKKSTVVEPIDWRTWAERQTRRDDNSMAKMMLMLAMGFLHEHTTTNRIPIMLVRKGSVIQALATQKIRVGELVVPLFF